MNSSIISLVEQSSLKAETPKFEIGDTVDVHLKIMEGAKERIQVFTGVVIATLVPVLLTAFMSIPLSLGGHPGELRMVSQLSPSHMT